MPLDDHNPCPACPLPVRDLYAAARRVLALAPPSTSPAHLDLQLALEVLRPFVEAHVANQTHAFSAELEATRHPALGSGATS